MRIHSIPLMSATLSGRVLVTGATGFIAAWIIQQLLEDGYHVRGTVRSAAKGASLQKIYAQFSDQFEPFIVRDMTEVSVELHRHDLPLTTSMSAGCLR